MKHELKWYESDGHLCAQSAWHDNEDHFKYRIRPPKGARVWWQLDPPTELGKPSRHGTYLQARAQAQRIEDGSLTNEKTTTRKGTRCTK